MAYTVDDLEYQLQEFCDDRDIDPGGFLICQQEIRASWENAFEEFLQRQKERATRYEKLYQELDKFDIGALFDELKRVISPQRMVEMILNATATITPLIRPDDGSWIQHPKYDEEFFVDAINGWRVKIPRAREDILDCIRNCFDLDVIDDDDD